MSNAHLLSIHSTAIEITIFQNSITWYDCIFTHTFLFVFGTLCRLYPSPLNCPKAGSSTPSTWSVTSFSSVPSHWAAWAEDKISVKRFSYKQVAYYIPVEEPPLWLRLRSSCHSYQLILGPVLKCINSLVFNPNMDNWISKLLTARECGSSIHRTGTNNNHNEKINNMHKPSCRGEGKHRRTRGCLCV